MGKTSDSLMMIATLHSLIAHSLAVLLPVLSWTVSHSGVTTGSIDNTPVYIGATDHRPISATLMLSQPSLGNALFNEQPAGPQPQRFRYPFRNSRDALATFAASVDSMVP
jgi:hypothetical protein